MLVRITGDLGWVGRTYLGFSNLRQIDLIREMAIAHSILIPISAAVALRTVDNREVTHVALVAHLKVDAHAPVDAGARAVDIDVCDAAFDDLGDDLAGSLVGCYADSGLVARVEVLADDGREIGGLDFIEGVAFFFVGVRERDSARVAVWHGGFDGFIQEVVHCSMLCLFMLDVLRGQTT